MARIITDYLDRSAALFPKKDAYIDQDKTITFGKLQEQAWMLGMNLIRKELFRQPIAVFLDKGIDCIVSFMGIAYSGNFYTVIDTRMPQTRIERIINTFQPKVILTDHAHKEYADRFGMGADIVCIEDTRKEIIDKEQLRATQGKIIDTDVLYVLFTSGSTGNPKGVIIGHRSVIDYIDWASDTFGFNEYNIFGNQAPFYFDNSVLDIYSTMRNGSTMHILPQKMFAFPVMLLDYICEHQINTVFFVPTVLVRIANLDLLDRCDVSSLKQVLFAGEVMPAKQLNMWIRALPDTLFANLYGPTEITVDCTYYIVDRVLTDDEPVPIGKACLNSDILVLNGNDELCRAGEKGELCVRGSSLSYGYYNNPEKTKEVFVQNPLNQAYYERIYRTGDLVHYNSDGELIYDGRKDYQIKHLGHRIELGEIETAASSMDGIQQCCCLHEKEKDVIVLVYSGSADKKELKKALMELLPDYMIPNACFQVSEMPVTLNGKIDRLRLADIIKSM